MKTLVIDPGYSSVKHVLIEGKKIRRTGREPTLVAEIPDWSLQVDFGMETEGDGIPWKGKRYLVGPPSIGGLEIPVTNPETLYGLALPLYLLKLGVTEGDRVVVLMSFADWERKEKVEELVKSFEAEPAVVPQGVGIWIEAGRPTDCAVVDVGFDTVDVLAFADGRPQKSLSFAAHGTGVVSFLTQLRKDDPKRLAEKLESGDEPLKSALREKYWSWLDRRLEAFPAWKVMRERRLIFGGGGARFVPKETGAVVKEPELANVKGMAKELLKGVRHG